MSHILLGFMNKELCRKIDDGPFYCQSDRTRSYFLCWLLRRNSIKKINDLWLHHCISMVECDPCKVHECHKSTSLPWKGLSHTSPWISTQSIQCKVVCKYIIPTSSLPLSAGDHNHSKYWRVYITHYVATGLSARIYLPVHGFFTQLSPKMKYFRFLVDFN